MSTEVRTGNSTVQNLFSGWKVSVNPEGSASTSFDCVVNNAGKKAFLGINVSLLRTDKVAIISSGRDTSIVRDRVSGDQLSLALFFVS